MSLVTEALQRLTKAVQVAPSRAEVEVVAVGDDDWRVSLPGSSPFALLGFVTRVKGRFRVQALARPFAEFEAASLDEAIDALRPSTADVPAILTGIRAA